MEEDRTCVACSGTGEGHWDGSSCGYCGGSGEYKEREDDWDGEDLYNDLD